MHRIGAHLKSAEQSAQSVGEGDVRVRQHAAESAGVVKGKRGGGRGRTHSHQREEFMRFMRETEVGIEEASELRHT